MSALISVVMSVYNTREDWLRLAIESILAQTYDRFEYIIILDKPTDHSEEIIKEYAARDDRIRVIENEQNMGLPLSLNRGVDAAEGEYICRMDSDDIAETTRLADELAYIESHDLDLIGGQFRRINEDGEVFGKQEALYIPQQIPHLLMEFNCIAHPTWMVKRELYTKLGGYRPIRYCEDYDFLLRALKISARMGICDSIVLNYRENMSGISKKNSLKQFLSTRYLQKEFGRIDDVTQDEINEYLSKEATDTEEERYATAQQHLREAREPHTSRIKRGVGMARAYLGSKNVRYIMRRAMRVKKYLRGGSR